MTTTALVQLGDEVTALRSAVVVALPDGIVASSWARGRDAGMDEATVADLVRLVARQADVIGHLTDTRAPARLVVTHADVRVVVEPLPRDLVAVLVFEPDYPEALAALHARTLAASWAVDSTGAPRREASMVARALARLTREAADPEVAALRVALRARVRPQSLLTPDALGEGQAAAVCEQIEIVLRQPMPGLSPTGGS